MIRKTKTGKGWASFFLFLLFVASLARQSTAGVIEKSDDLSSAIIRVARETIPAVVHLEVSEAREPAYPTLPFDMDPFFRHFFNSPNLPRKFHRKITGLGTGMIIDPRGHILTNHHVVTGATKIEVFLSDGTHFPGRLIGTDPKTDLAVLQISTGKPLPHVIFGDSDQVEVGEWVIAIGDPRGLDRTVTKGIISAKHRRGITVPSSYQDFLQTDAALNPGNSGGPLVDLRGKVIGVNAVIVTESGGFEGIGFTIPINMARPVALDLIAQRMGFWKWLKSLFGTF
jgi:serine protease Do